MMLNFLSGATIIAGLFAGLHLPAAGIAAVPKLFLFIGSYDFLYMPLFIAYPAEILPFKLRAKGIAIVLSTDALAGLLNQYINPVAFVVLHWRYYCVYLASLIMFWMLFSFLFPETKGMPLGGSFQNRQ